MIEVSTLVEKIKKKQLDKIYIFCGHDESLIKEGVNFIVKAALGTSFIELNYISFQGNSLEGFDPIFNACETLPFMNEKKVVVINRALFLEDSRGESKSQNEKIYKEFTSYVEKVPDYCILILIHTFLNKRDKISQKINRLDKKVCIVKSEKLKGAKLEAKVNEIVEGRGKKIGKVELKALVSRIQENNLSVIENEVEKLCCYVGQEEIKKEDICFLFEKSNDDDIFDLINCISTKKPKNAIEMLNELIFKGEKIPHILNMIERSFNNLFRVKIGMDSGKTKEQLISELKLNPYQCEILMGQSRNFTKGSLLKAIEICLKTEQRLKSSSIDIKTEMELLIINTITG